MKLKSFEEFRQEVLAELGADVVQLSETEIDDLAHWDIVAQHIETGRFPYGYVQPARFK